MNGVSLMLSILKKTKGWVENSDSYNNIFNQDKDNVSLVKHSKAISICTPDLARFMLSDNTKQSQPLKLSNLTKTRSRNILSTISNSSRLQTSPKESITWQYKPILQLPRLPSSRYPSHWYLLSDFLDDPKYEELSFHDGEISCSRSKTNEYINKCIRDLSENVNTDRRNRLKYSKMIYKDMYDFELKSITMKFTTIAPVNGSHNLEYSLPFTLVPLFYHKGFDNIKEMLRQCLLFTSSSETVSFDYNSIPDILKENLKCMSKKERGVTMKKQCSSTEDSTSIGLVDDYHQFEFILTTVNKSYKVTVNMPWVEMNCPSKKLRIIKYINVDLLVFLAGKHYENWEFYIINNWFRYQLFRHALNNTLSKSMTWNTNNINKTICLTKPIKVQTDSPFNTSLIYLHSNDNGVNDIVTINAVKLEIEVLAPVVNSSSNDIRPVKHSIKFNFKASKRLIKSTIFFGENNVKLALMKFVTVQFGKVKFDFITFNSFSNEEWCHWLDTILKDIKLGASSTLTNIINGTGEGRKMTRKYTKRDWMMNRFNNIVSIALLSYRMEINKKGSCTDRPENKEIKLDAIKNTIMSNVKNIQKLPMEVQKILLRL